jgi:hypothetical protein
VETGGDCADVSRLLIIFLHLHGIHSSKVALYDSNLKPQHAVVEVDIENNNKMVVDAYYGLFFPKPLGGYYSLSDLKSREEILHARIAQLVALATDTQPPKLSRYPYNLYTYSHPRTINWDKSSARQFLYQTLKFLFGEEWVDSLERPYFVERPVLIMLYSIFLLQATLLLTYASRFRRWLSKEQKSIIYS